MLKKIGIAVFLIIVLALGACSDADSDVEQEVGFNLLGGTVEEAADIPAAAKEEILKAFATYIDAFNEKDIDRYIETLSEHAENFDKEEERAYMTEEVFSEYNLDRVASDVTIVKYSEEEAQVFAKLQTTMKQISSGLEINPTGRQVTVFAKEAGEWKVSSIYYIGDDEKE